MSIKNEQLLKYDRALARELGVNTAIFIAYLESLTKNDRPIVQQLEAERNSIGEIISPTEPVKQSFEFGCGLTKRQTNLIRENLKERGILVEEKKKYQKIINYKLNKEALQKIRNEFNADKKSESYVLVDPVLLRNIGINESIFIGYMLYLQDYSKLENGFVGQILFAKKDVNKKILLTKNALDQSFEQQISLTRKQIDLVRINLKRLDLLNESKSRNDNRCLYQINGVAFVVFKHKCVIKQKAQDELDAEKSFQRIAVVAPPFNVKKVKSNTEVKRYDVTYI